MAFDNSIMNNNTSPIQDEQLKNVTTVGRIEMKTSSNSKLRTVRK